MDRRTFIAGATAALAAPSFIRSARAATTPRLRRDVQSLAPSDPFFAKYAEAVKKMHDLPDSDPRKWRNQALIHLNHCPHSRTSFVHWHRHYILNYELICGQLIGDPDFALAYWNWSAKSGIIPDPFYDLDQLNVVFWNDPSNAQSDNWDPAPVRTVGKRALPKGRGLQDDPNAGQFFTQAFIDGIQQTDQFQIMTGQLETSPHNNAHVISGGGSGHMGNGMSPLDPIFWLHHCNIDRIWAEWQTPGNTTPPLNLNYDNQFVNGTGQPVRASSASALDFAAMNYTYDTLSSTVVAQQIEQLGLPKNRPAARLAAAVKTPQILGTAADAKTVVPGVETRFTVAATNLAANLFRQRAFLATKAPTVQRLAIGTGKILAKLSDVTAPGSEAPPIICKVFVNRQDLSPSTPTTDPLCAGSFSFFGSHGAAHGHGEFYVDLSGPLHVLFKDGAVDPAKVNIQLMAVTLDAADGASANATFKVGKVQLISA